ncbi:MAG: D-glutamate deacylase, partial [Vicinamibacterales bacterium]
MTHRIRAAAGFVLLTSAVLGLAARQPAYDLVIRGGRVIDPETGLDGVRNVGIVAGRIAAVATAELDGRETLDARTLVVAPGFIDLHVHVNDAQTYRLAAQQGVTTALEMEVGVADVATFYAERRGK